MIDKLERLLSAGQDTPVLRFGLGNAYLQCGEPERAALHLRAAVAQKSDYTAAWKLLGKALLEAGDADAARHAFEEGITLAETNGDKQAEKEMRVFLKRLQDREH